VSGAVETPELLAKIAHALAPGRTPVIDVAPAEPAELEPEMIPDDPTALEPLSGPVHPFRFDDQDGGYTVRVVDRDGEPWWIAGDLCLAIGLNNVSQAVTRLEEDEKTIISIDTPGGAQGVLAVSEPGMYSLLLRSDKARAKRFKRWVTHDVLPQIRHTGRYEVAPAHPQLLGDYVSALEALIASEKQKLLAEQRTEVARRRSVRRSIGCRAGGRW
jgi:prophage antirepressor-like protein